MSIRKVKQYSDRGKIKDLGSRHESEAPTLPSELRLKKLYEYAKLHNDVGILNALGFITTEYVGDKNALPLTVYRIKQIVADISSRPGSKVQELKEFFDRCINPSLSQEAMDYLFLRKMLKKVASKNREPAFRRVT